MEARIRFNRSEGFIVFRSSSYNREKSVRTTVHHRYQQCCEMYFGTGNFCPDLNQNIFSCVRIWIGLKIRIHKNAQVQEEEEEMFLSYFSTLCQVPPKPNQRTSFRSISSGKKLKLKLKQKTDRSKSRFLKSGYGSAKKKTGSGTFLRGSELFMSVLELFVLDLGPARMKEQIN